jgi:hypothetical protein
MLKAMQDHYLVLFKIGVLTFLAVSGPYNPTCLANGWQGIVEQWLLLSFFYKTLPAA